MKDDFAKEIVRHWLYGKGEFKEIANDTNWDTFMTTNPNVQRRIESAAQAALASGCFTFSAERESIALSETGTGDYRTGYGLINGSNIDYGGFSFSGTITHLGGNNYRVTGEYIFNDYVDPNYGYSGEQEIEDLVRKVINKEHGRNYQLRIEGEFDYEFQFDK